jgi:phosphoribosyl 1,2-cyclic phosphodiesterase
LSLFVKFWGVRGSIPTPGWATQRYGGNTSCVEIRTDDARFICDGGSGIRELGASLLREAAGSPVAANLLFSHAHWDHIQGFPFFGPAYLKSSRLTVYGTGAGDDKMVQLLSGQMTSDDYFPVRFSDLGAVIQSASLTSGANLVDGVQIRSHPVFHPGGSTSFRFDAGGRRVVFATDNELDLVLENAEEAAADPEAPRICPPELVDFVRGADLLIADGQYTDLEYKSRVNWGHSRATTLVDLAAQANVRRVAVFHHDPMQVDADVERKIAACVSRANRMGVNVDIFAAREGFEIKLPF